MDQRQRPTTSFIESGCMFVHLFPKKGEIWVNITRQIYLRENWDNQYLL